MKYSHITHWDYPFILNKRHKCRQWNKTHLGYLVFNVFNYTVIKLQAVDW